MRTVPCVLCIRISRLTLAVCLLVSSVGMAHQASSLLKRPRMWWEWNPQHAATDVDHLGNGWDDIYLGDHSANREAAHFRYRQAEREFKYELERTLPDKSGPLDVHVFLGAARGLVEVGYRMGTLAMVKPIYLEGIRRAPDAPLIYAHYALYLRLCDALSEAIAVMEKAVQMVPNDRGLHINLGLLYFENKQYDLAAEENTLARQLGAGDSDLQKKLDTLAQPPAKK